MLIAKLAPLLTPTCKPLSSLLVLEIIAHVHSPNYLRDFYHRFDQAVHNALVKPGGDYKQMLELAEEQHMKTLLEDIRQQRAKAIEQADEEGLDDYEADNLLWNKTHAKFKSVMDEMAAITNVILAREEEERRHLQPSPRPARARHANPVEQRGTVQEPIAPILLNRIRQR